MSALLDRLTPIIRDADAQRPFEFVALIRREGGIDWDLIVAAPWLRRGVGRSHAAFSDLVRGSLDEDGLLDLGRIIIVNPSDRELAREVARYRSESPDLTGGPLERHHFTFSGVPIEVGYVLVARPAPAARRSTRRPARVG